MFKKENNVLYPTEFHEAWAVGDVECVKCGHKWVFTTQQKEPITLECPKCGVFS